MQFDISIEQLRVGFDSNVLRLVLSLSIQGGMIISHVRRPGAIKIASTEHEARSKEAGEIAACGVVTPVAPRCDEGGPACGGTTGSGA